MEHIGSQTARASKQSF
uniref:Uncharacterized protein n=1 Tax=Arundo donax TaxID=35708 RepID=A0A0A9HNP0_ARUDO